MAEWLSGPLMSTVTPGSTAPVLSTMAVSIRPVETCACDGVATASMAAHNTVSVAIGELIIHPPRQKTRANTQTNGVRSRTPNYERGPSELQDLILKFYRAKRSQMS